MRTDREQDEGKRPTQKRRLDGPRERLACVDLPALPLQLLLRRQPEFSAGPAAVVDRDHPQGRILWVNEEGRQGRVLPGQRYAAALGICPGLAAAEVSPEEIAAGVDEVARLLDNFSPAVEPAHHEPGVFWIDAGGLVRLHPSLLEWAERLHTALVAEDLQGSVVCGFGRFGTYALARASRGGAHLVVDEEEERRLVGRVPLARLDIAPKLRDALLRLGVRNVDEFLRLPAEGVATRFGKKAEALHRTASGELIRPLAARPPTEPPVRRIHFEMPETKTDRLLYAIEEAVPPLLAEIAARREALVSLHLRLSMEDGPPRLMEARPAAPTLDAAQALELLRLRLEAMVMHRGLGRGVEEAILTARGVYARPEQLRLFRENPRRDLKAAARALARVRAQFGPHSVVLARLAGGHLPEASFALTPVEKVHFPDPRMRAADGPLSLIRRILTRPAILPPRPRHEPDGWLLAGMERGPVRRSVGPYVLAGAWWGTPPGEYGGVQAGVHREYHFAETARGDLFWVFHDRRRRRWYLHGTVE